MVCTANDLSGWSDFPKGLRVLLLDADTEASAEIKLKLEKMDYIVSSFCNDDDAFLAISNTSENFHLAIVEVNIENSYGRFKFLESTKDFPTIMTSNTQCLGTMMKCIALGAVEFLLKPLSDDKLKNLWQHVVHKAFNGGEKDLPASLDPVKESVCSMLLQCENNLSVKTEEYDHENSVMSVKYPAPSTPQLKHGVRLMDDGDCQDQTNVLTEKESVDHDGESKFVETTNCNISGKTDTKVCQPECSGEIIVNNEDQGYDNCKRKSNLSSQPKCKGHERSAVNNSRGKKANQRKMKVDWTPELHKKFVKAVEQLGVDQAIPSRILELMQVEGLTRHNIASHLQKYRVHHRHILPKDDDRRWPPRRDLYQRNPQRPIMAYPPYHNGPVYPASVPPGNYPSWVQIWAPAYYTPWQNESWHWQQYPGMHADTWGCPLMPPPDEPYQPPPQNVDGFHKANVIHGSYGVSQDSFDIHPTEEMIDRVVKEAISKPWLPLPIGLNLPSTESVLAELSNQGILRTTSFITSNLTLPHSSPHQ